MDSKDKCFSPLQPPLSSLLLFCWTFWKDIFLVFLVFLAIYLPAFEVSLGHESPSGTLSRRLRLEKLAGLPVSDALPAISAFPLLPGLVCLPVCSDMAGARTHELACFSERIVLIWNWQRSRKYFPNWGWLMGWEGGDLDEGAVWGIKLCDGFEATNLWRKRENEIKELIKKMYVIKEFGRMWSPVFVCLCVTRISQKYSNGFWWEWRGWPWAKEELNRLGGGSGNSFSGSVNIARLATFLQISQKVSSGSW